MRARLLLLVVALLSVSLLSPVNASTIQLVVTEDKLTGYKRSAFKHWIDADKNGCNTRAEVLIEEAFANDLENSEALIAVTASTNRSKGDKDPSLWMPAKGQCVYTQNWISIKVKYSLTADPQEVEKLNSLVSTCGLDGTTEITPVPEVSPEPTQTAEPSVSVKIITPGAFCAPAGATGVSKTGVSYTCKTSSTDTRNRWRQ
jgi:hypothetical protein